MLAHTKRTAQEIKKQKERTAQAVSLVLCIHSPERGCSSPDGAPDLGKCCLRCGIGGGLKRDG